MFRYPDLIVNLHNWSSYNEHRWRFQQQYSLEQKASTEKGFLLHMNVWTLLLTLAFTLYMTGVIWSMQVLEYPLFARVGRDEFRAYHAFHNRTLPFLIILSSLLALVSAVLLLWIRPASVPLWSAVLVMVLDLAVLTSTAAWQAPLHEKLDRKGFSTEIIGTLVRSNWIRTALWTINALLLLGMTATALLAAR
jgi:hypothetical protein